MPSGDALVGTVMGMEVHWVDFHFLSLSLSLFLSLRFCMPLNCFLGRTIVHDLYRLHPCTDCRSITLVSRISFDFASLCSTDSSWFEQDLSPPFLLGWFCSVACSCNEDNWLCFSLIVLTFVRWKGMHSPGQVLAGFAIGCVYHFYSTRTAFRWRFLDFFCNIGASLISIFLFKRQLPDIDIGFVVGSLNGWIWQVRVFLS